MECHMGNCENGTVYILVTCLDQEKAVWLDLKEMKHVVVEYCLSCT